MITERTLRKWRKEALRDTNDKHIADGGWIDLCNRILQLTQELLDQHLLRK